jgi:predicted Zn finger-like uncharacterized protein
MQANCPTCGKRLAVDDARVPDRPFAVRCPACQTSVRFPGRTGAAAPSAEEPGATAPPDADAVSDLVRARRDLAVAAGARHVLVGVPDSSLADVLTQPLARLGYGVETLDAPEEGGRLLEQGLFDVVVTSLEFSVSRNETVYQRITRLPPETRRRLFLILVDDQFITGDGNQAFAAQADLVVNPGDARSVEPFLLGALYERRRLFEPYLDALRRADAAGR